MKRHKKTRQGKKREENRIQEKTLEDMRRHSETNLLRVPFLLQIFVPLKSALLKQDKTRENKGEQEKTREGQEKTKKDKRRH